MLCLLKEWYSELLERKKGVCFKNRLVYKGFVLTKNSEKYDIHFSSEEDGYEKVCEKTLSTLTDKGFIEGVDHIIHQKNLKRLVYHKKSIKELSRIKETFSEGKHINSIYTNDNKKNLQHVLKNHVEAYYEVLVRINNFKEKYKNY
jgi:hypothetical protein